MCSTKAHTRVYVITRIYLSYVYACVHVLYCSRIMYICWLKEIFGLVIHNSFKLRFNTDWFSNADTKTIKLCEQVARAWKITRNSGPIIYSNLGCGVRVRASINEGVKRGYANTQTQKTTEIKYCQLKIFNHTAAFLFDELGRHLSFQISSV